MSLSMSGKWADSPPPADFVMEDYHPETVADQLAEVGEFFPEKREPDLDDEIFDDPRYDAEVLWIKRTYQVGEAAIRAAILKAFEDSGLEGVEIVMLYITTNKLRDHAYLVMNSAQATDMLIDGTVSPVIRTKIEPEFLPEDAQGNEEFRDVTLWMDIADHLVPTDDQDPFTLYLWQLPTDRQAIEVEAELRKIIECLCPIYRLEVKENRDGRCGSWAKVGFKYEDHTRKCVYMLNYNRFLGNEIRAAFFQLNAATAKAKEIVNPPPVTRPRIAAQKPNQKKIPRPSRKEVKPKQPLQNKRSPKGNRKPLPKNRQPPQTKAPAKKIAEGADGWTVVGREGRK